MKQQERKFNISSTKKTYKYTPNLSCMIYEKYISKYIIVWDISTEYNLQYAAADPLLCSKVVSYSRGQSR